MEEKKIIRRVGNYTTGYARQEECKRCKNAKFATVLIDDLCLDCYTESLSQLGTNMPCHINYGSECCGIFNKIEDRTVVCNECGMNINEITMGNKAKIVVWKSGGYKFIPSGITWEYENDKDWLVTINLGGGK